MLRPPFRGFERRRFGFDGSICRVMRVVTMGAEEVGSLPSGEIPRPLSVDPCFPVPVDVPVAFATEPVAFCEADELPIVKP